MNIGKKLGKSTITIAVFVVIALILGIIIGHVSSDLFYPSYQFKGGENILHNSGFEEGTNNEPYYWFQAIVPKDNLELSWDNEIQYNGSRSVSINNTHIYDETVCNNWAQIIYNVPKERTVELSSWVKTIDAESVVMVIQCWGFFGDMVAFGTTQTYQEIKGTTDWKMCNTSVFVPNETNIIIIRLVLTGTGKVWFDDVALVTK